MTGETDRDQAASYSVPPVERAIRVLRYVAKGNDCSNISIASKALSINRTTLIRILHTLDAERMIEKMPGGRGYRLGVALIGLAADAMSNRDVLAVGRPRLSQLAAETTLSAHLGVLDGRDLVYLIREVPRAHLVSNVREGTRLPAHATTMGRAVLAHLPPDEVSALYYEAPMPEYTAATATSLDALFAQLAGDRKSGIAWSDGYFEPSIGSCACPVFDHRGAVLAAINVSGAASEFGLGTERARILETAVRRAALDISRQLGFSDQKDRIAGV